MRDTMRSRMSSLLDRLNKLQTARTELVRQLEAIEADSKILQTEYNLLHNESQPVSVLPCDILAMIFKTAKYTAEGSEITMSHVSRYWRYIALGTPLLWAVMRGVRHLRGRVIAYLERSKAAPIYLFVEIDSNNVSQMCDVIISHIGRCRELNIISPGYVPGIVECLSSQHAPLLKHFNFSIHFPMGLSGTHTALVPLQIFANGAPSLTSMSLERLSPLICRLPPTPLTALHLDHYQLSSHQDACGFCDMILASTSLRQLELCLKRDSGLRWPSDVVFPLPALHVLLIRAHKTQISALLAAVHAPSLQILQLAVPYSSDDEFEHSSVLSWPAKFTALHTLVYGHFSSPSGMVQGQVDMGVHAMRKVARGFPTITNLTCTRAPLDLFTVLEETQDPSWTNLQTLRLFPSSDNSYATAAAIRQLLNKRIDMGRPIRKVLVDQTFSSEDMQGLRRLAQIEEYIDDWPNPFSAYQL